MREMNIPFELMGRGCIRVGVPDWWSDQRVHDYILNKMNIQAILELSDKTSPPNILVLDDQVNPDVDIMIMAETTHSDTKNQ